MQKTALCFTAGQLSKKEVTALFLHSLSKCLRMCAALLQNGVSWTFLHLLYVSLFLCFVCGLSCLVPIILFHKLKGLSSSLARHQSKPMLCCKYKEQYCLQVIFCCKSASAILKKWRPGKLFLQITIMLL